MQIKVASGKASASISIIGAGLAMALPDQKWIGFVLIVIGILIFVFDIRFDHDQIESGERRLGRLLHPDDRGRQVAIWRAMSAAALAVAAIGSLQFVRLPLWVTAFLLWGAVLLLVGSVIMVFSIALRDWQKGRKVAIPIIIMAFGIVIFITGAVWYALSGHEPEAVQTTQKSSEAENVPVPHRYYAAGDRERLSELLSTMDNYINDNISPEQLEVHRLSSGPGTAQTVTRLSELRDKLKVARIYLGDLSQINSYYQDEIEDVLGNRDLLYADIMAINSYIDLVSAVSPDPQDRAAKIIMPAVEKLHEANGDLGTWISQCIRRIKAKRDALQ